MSKSDQFMKQCTLVRVTKGGFASTVSWLPEQFVKIGNYVMLKNEEGEWVDGWKIITHSTEKRSYDDINKQSQEYKSMSTYGRK